MHIPGAADDPTLFPSENPNPVFRAAADGLILFANRASEGLLAAWGARAGDYLPGDWRKQIWATLESGRERRVSEPCGDRVIELDLVPIPARNYVNVYGRDVTEQEAARREREALLAELKLERDLQQTLMENTRASLVYLDRDFNFVRMNAAYEAACQRPASEMLGRNHFDLFPNAENEAIFRRVRDTGEAVEFLAKPFEFADQPWRGVTYWDWTLTPVKGDGGGDVVGLVFSLLDVTERRLAAETLEKRVQERTAELEAIVTSIPDALYVADASGIIRCNQSALDDFGCDSVEELQGKLAVVDERMQSRYADTGRPIPREELGLVRALRGERTVLDVLSRNPKTHQDQIHRVATAPIVLNGEVTAAVALAANITEQRRAQERIAYLARLLENINDAVIAYDADLRITAWNRRAEELYGWKAAEVMGAYAADVVGSQVTAELRADRLRSMAETGRWCGELTHVRRDGTPIAIETNSMMLRDATGRVSALVSVNRDITERKRAEEELRASHEQLRSLSRRLVERQESERSFVANELYNDEGQRLAAVLLELGLMKKETNENQALSERITRVTELADGVLYDMHSLAVNLRPASLDRLGLMAGLSHYADALRRKSGREIDIEMSGPKALSLPPDTETMIYRIAQEALANAIQHTQASCIDIIATQHAHRLVLVIEDDGQGFDEQEAMRRGGLGIVGMRERAEMLGGRLTIESKPGNGTAVYIEVPCEP